MYKRNVETSHFGWIYNPGVKLSRKYFLCVTLIYNFEGVFAEAPLTRPLLWLPLGLVQEKKKKKGRNAKQ